NVCVGASLGSSRVRQDTIHRREGANRQSHLPTSLSSHHSDSFPLLYPCHSQQSDSTKRRLKNSDPISCITDGGVPAHVINTFCWITYTFTLPGVVGDPGTHVAHPGVASAGPDEEKKYHAYYQWVPFMLFFQVMYLPFVNKPESIDRYCSPSIK
ncbi:unnamed protein product, partial [Nesidiocoris tenuis]